MNRVPTTRSTSASLPSSTTKDMSSIGSGRINTSTTNRTRNNHSIDVIKVTNNVHHDVSSQQEQQPFVLDVVSIASNTRLDYMEAQKAYMTSHAAVRHFLYVTEEDDIDQGCKLGRVGGKLHRADIRRIHNFCTKKDNFDFGGHLPYWGDLTKGRLGWLCAQTRPQIGFIQMIRERYYNTNSDGGVLQEELLPDYLMILDDDTFVNIEEFIQTLTRIKTTISNSNSTSKPSLLSKYFDTNPIAGYMFGGRSYIYPHGGYGIFIPKNLLKVLSKPIQEVIDVDQFLQQNASRRIYSEMERHLQHQLLSQQRRSIARNNSLASSNRKATTSTTTTIADAADSSTKINTTMLDLIYNIVTYQPFSKYKEWKRTDGYCFHSDWVWGYFFQPSLYFSHKTSMTGIVPYGMLDRFYGTSTSINPSIIALMTANNNASLAQSVEEVGMEVEKQTSKTLDALFDRKTIKRGQCRYNNKPNCNLNMNKHCKATSSSICHYVGPDQFNDLHQELKELYPTKFQ